MTYDTSQPQTLNGSPNPLYLQVKGPTLASITDGTSNTAMYAEIKRSRFPYPAPAADPLNYIDQMNLIGGFTNLHAPDAACATLSSRITYRGNEYFRFIVQNSNYSHTVVPNYTSFDCGDSGINASHTASRSYHSGGVNVCFVDGSVHFIKSTINIVTWMPWVRGPAAR